MPARDIDHLVVMTSDLESARAGWEQLGFTTTPRAVHPFGTANSLIQLQGNFIELVEVDDAARIPPMAGSFFSFAAHNQARSEEHTSELQSLMRISYAVFCLKKKKQTICTKDS